MKKGCRILLKALSITVAAVAGILLAAQLLLISPLPARIAEGVAADMLDCSLDIARIRVSLFREFPSVRVNADGVSLTYPHSRFSSYDAAPFAECPYTDGQGEEVDTLLSLSRLTVSLNPWPLLKGNVEVREAGISDLGLFARSYDDTTANWNVYIPSEETDTTSSSFALSRIRADRVFLDGRTRVVFCSLGSLLAAGVNLKSLEADAMLHFDGDSLCVDNAAAGVKLDGRYLIRYPVNAEGGFRLDLDVAADSLMRVDAVLNDLGASARGLSLSLSGSGKDLLGDPVVDFDASAKAGLEDLVALLPEDMGISAEGSLDLSVGGVAKLSEFKNFRFETTRLDALVKGGRIAASMPADSLDIRLYSPEIILNSSKAHVDAGVCADSIFYKSGKTMSARIRSMKNSGKICMVESRGTMTPRLEFSNSEKSVFLRSGRERLLLGGLEIDAAVQKHVVGEAGFRRVPDSLMRRKPGFPQRERDELYGSNVSVSLDSTFSRYLRQWDPEGRLKVKRGAVISPAIPLRTRLAGLEAGFDSRSIHLDTLGLRCGSSDIGADGRIYGLLRMLRSRSHSGLIRAELNVNSNRLNANELLAAMQMGKEKLAEVSGEGLREDDESFVVDSIAGDGTTSFGAVYLPGNVDAQLNVDVRHVDWSDIVVEPLNTELTLKNRCAQVRNTLVASNLGDIRLDAFYSTRSKEDISAGVNLGMEKISAEGIIHLLPIVDSLMPALKSFKGDLGLQLAATTRLDSSLNVVMPSVEGIMRIKGENLKVEDAGDLRKLTRLLMFRNKNIGEIQNLYVDAIVHDNKAQVFPFILGVDRYQLALQGMQGFDNTMDYHVSILKSPFLIHFGVDMYGTLDNWRIGLTRAKYRKGVPVFTSQLDSMQLNISDYVKNVYKAGEEARLASFRKGFNRDVISRIGEGDVKEGALSADEYMQIEALNFAADIEEETDALLSDIDKMLDGMPFNVAALSEEYDKLTAGAARKKKIEALKK